MAHECYTVGMTTIVGDALAGIMCADSRCVIGDRWVEVDKLIRGPAGELIGTAGPMKESADWERWYLGGKKGAMPKLDQVEVLILRKEGLVYVDSSGCEIAMTCGYYAIGSGGAAAMGALHALHDHADRAARALEIACRVDVGSGGGMQSMSLTERNA